MESSRLPNVRDGADRKMAIDFDFCLALQGYAGEINTNHLVPEIMARILLPETLDVRLTALGFTAYFEINFGPSKTESF